jgi:hypothetical protein
VELTIAFLGSAAIGSLLGLLIKEGIDFLRAEKAHRNEMQRRYFDAKLEASLRAIQQLKSNTSALKAVFNMVHNNEKTGGWIDPGLLNVTLQSVSTTLQRVNDQTAGVIALLGFYYDDDLVRLVESGATPSVPLLQKMSEFGARVAHLVQVRHVLEVTPDVPEDLRAAVEKQAADNEQEIQLVIGDLSKISDALDELSNEVVRRMRDSYLAIRI